MDEIEAKYNQIRALKFPQGLYQYNSLHPNKHIILALSYGCGNTMYFIPKEYSL
jgi:hypothetical protein